MGKTGGGPERLPAQLSQVNPNAAGIDVGATSHWPAAPGLVAVPADRAEQPVLEVWPESDLSGFPADPRRRIPVLYGVIVYDIRLIHLAGQRNSMFRK